MNKLIQWTTILTLAQNFKYFTYILFIFNMRFQIYFKFLTWWMCMCNQIIGPFFMKEMDNIWIFNHVSCKLARNINYLNPI